MQVEGLGYLNTVSLRKEPYEETNLSLLTCRKVHLICLQLSRFTISVDWSVKMSPVSDWQLQDTVLWWASCHMSNK